MSKKKRKNANQKEIASQKINKASQRNKMSQSKKTVITLSVTIILLVIMCAALVYIIANARFYKETDNSQNISDVVEAEYIVKPSLNYKDGERISQQDLTIKWENISAADKYKYNVVLLDGQPDYGNVQEERKKGSVILAKNVEGTPNNSIFIEKDKLVSGKWVKIAVAACKEDYELWESIYIYIE